uniref:Uncharacterized protein n=1 Tax=Anguilla anguilla TaxID=7936 RepID=A0A0E9U1M5_ANGAN
MNQNVSTPSEIILRLSSSINLRTFL